MADTPTGMAPDASTHGGPRIELREVDADNFRQVMAVRVREDQVRFVSTPAEYLALCRYGGVWRPLALYEGGEAAGFAMWGVDPADGSHWIGGLLIDRSRQGRGLGRAAMQELMAFLSAKGAREVALSYDPENSDARRLYRSLGFRETGEHEDEEVVARLELPVSPSTSP